MTEYNNNQMEQFITGEPDSVSRLASHQDNPSLHGNYNQRHRAKAVVSTLLAFVLSTVLVLLTVLVIVQATLLNDQYMKTQVDKSNYVTLVKDEIDNSFISYGQSSGFEESFFSGKVTDLDLRQDLVSELNKLYNPNSSGANVDKFRTDIYVSMIDYAKAQGDEITPEVDEAVSYLADLCKETYRLEVTTPFTTQLYTALHKLQGLMIFGFIGIGLLFLVVIAFLLGVHKKKYRAVPYVSYSFLSAGLVLLVASLVVLFSNIIGRLGILNKPLYELVTTYIENIFVMTIWAAGFFIIFAILIAIIYLNTLRHRRRTR
ncbi:MAG: hypothetical protein LBN22_11790 [Clostridiales Family XIII bacterium]|jgi:hypothetical protein|nr:hypothetical protein [Clostridiales Family XIII bacterium]